VISLSCDREGCDTWQRMTDDTEDHWVIVHLNNPDFEDEVVTRHFCTVDCLMHWAAANSVPTEVIRDEPE
jgi:hypothetical protein